MDISYNNKRIAKNTLLLYFRMLFTMGVALYTSRIVLATLGVEDYGIYNVVGGVVAMFGFLNSAMSSVTQRYLTFELENGDFERLQRIFCTSINIHVFIAICIFILGETIGLWFLYNKMVIPESRMQAAMWVYQMSILSTMMLVVSVPYNAAIIAHEKMSAFAYISVFEVISKLLMVYLLAITVWDRLIIYAILLFIIQLLTRIVYSNYCNHHFKETKYRFIFDKSLFQEMLAFAGWNLCGNIAGILSTQGLNILLNMFFGPVINAARAIAVQVQNAIQMFSANFQMALNPQITKSYAVNDMQYMHSLIFRSSKYTFLLLFFLSLPVMIKTPMILHFWLKTVPDYTVSFLRLMLCVTILDCMANPLMISAAATGRVRRYQSIVGGILLSIVPLSYLVLKSGGDPISVFFVHLCICICAFVVRLFIVKPMIKLSLSNYSREVLLRMFYVVLLSVPLPLLINYYLSDNFGALFLICVVCVLMTILSTYFVGLNSVEREFVACKLLQFKEKIFKY